MNMVPDLAYGLQVLVNAGPVTALYAGLSYGYGLAFGLVRRPDLAPGALFAFAGQIAVLFAGLGWSVLMLLYPAALAFAAVAAILYAGMISQIWSTRVTPRVSIAGPNAMIIASLGLMIALMESVRIASDAHEGFLSPVLADPFTLVALADGTVLVTPMKGIVTLLPVVVIVVHGVLRHRSQSALAWRAVADEPLAARLLGVDVEGVIATAHRHAATIGAGMGTLFTIHYGAMDFGAGLIFGLKVVMIASLGAVTSPMRAAIGGAVFGLAESLWGAYLPLEWRDIAMFAALVLIAVRSSAGRTP